MWWWLAGVPVSGVPAEVPITIVLGNSIMHGLFYLENEHTLSRKEIPKHEQHSDKPKWHWADFSATVS